MRPASFAPVVLVALAAVLLLTGGCAEESVDTEDIVSAFPWPDEERAEYVIVDRDDGEELLRGVLSVQRRGDQFELGLRFEQEDQSDESTVLVDAATLKPETVRREVRADEVQIINGEYDREAGVVKITESDEAGEKRSVPLRLKEHYYDNESSLFLWRTVDMAEGYRASYYSVLTNQNAQHLVTVRVGGRDEITVPAGTFQAWRVEIRTQGRTQAAWYADTPERTLVQYDNSQGQLFQLTGLPGG